RVVVAEVADRDALRAELREPERDRPADPSRAAGHEDRGAVEVHVRNGPGRGLTPEEAETDSGNVARPGRTLCPCGPSRPAGTRPGSDPRRARNERPFMGGAAAARRPARSSAAPPPPARRAGRDRPPRPLR